MREIKEAFEKVKLDLYYLNKNFNVLAEELFELKRDLLNLKEGEKENQRIPSTYKLKLPSFVPKIEHLHFNLDASTDTSTGNEGVKTNEEKIQTDINNFKPRKDQIYPISIGNEGVQTDRQTHQQTDNNPLKSSYNQNKTPSTNLFNSQTKKENLGVDTAIDALNSLDRVKKGLRLKFKRLTNQELLIFSTIYQLEEEFDYTTYKMVSDKLKLSESSIRDYVRRILAKDIPLVKEKVNNKEILLHISPDLKSILSLNSLLELRNL